MLRKKKFKNHYKYSLIKELVKWLKKKNLSLVMVTQLPLM